MTLVSKTTLAAALAALSLTGLTAAAQASAPGPHGTPASAHRSLDGYFTVNARGCPDLREDRRDARRHTGRADRREDRRDRQVINCPSRAFDYVPTRFERRQGFTGDRLNVNQAFLDRRTGRYFVETRFGDVPLRLGR